MATVTPIGKTLFVDQYIVGPGSAGGFHVDNGDVIETAGLEFISAHIVWNFSSAPTDFVANLNVGSQDPAANAWIQDAPAPDKFYGAYNAGANELQTNGGGAASNNQAVLIWNKPFPRYARLQLVHTSAFTGSVEVILFGWTI